MNWRSISSVAMKSAIRRAHGPHDLDGLGVRRAWPWP
jgi:hypothetical protein